MDSRIYFHQNRRPRYSNPTYISNNVNNSLTFFSTKRNSDQQSMYGHYLKQKITNLSNEGHSRVNRSIDNYNMSNLQPNNNYHTIGPNVQNYQNRGQSLNNRSQLSSYGSNSLTLNQKDIFNKQNQKFDIISMQPKNFDTSIRQYPAFTVENKDQLYYKRMSENINKQNKQQQIKMSQHSKKYEQMIAGKPTYNSKINQNYKNNYQMYTEDANHHFNPENAAKRQDNKNKYFNPKILNHMDQLSSLS